MQILLTLEQLMQRFSTLPTFTLQHVHYLIDARLECKEWAFNNVDLPLQNISFGQGDWRRQDG